MMENFQDHEKLKSMQGIAGQAIDTSTINFKETRKFIIAQTNTRQGFIPSYVGLGILTLVNGACRLHEFDELTTIYNGYAFENGWPQVDCDPKHILGSLFALFDVCYFDDKTQILHKNLNASSDLNWWKENVFAEIRTDIIDKLYDVAKSVKHQSLIL